MCNMYYLQSDNYRHTLAQAYGEKAASRDSAW